MRLLVGITWAHDIEIVANAIKESLSDFDKLFCYYYSANTARQIIRSQFLEHKEYTHLAILPDDLIVTKQDVNLLVHTDIMSNPDLPVVCGCCNVDTTTKKDCLNVSTVLPSPMRRQGTHDYVWVRENTEEYEVLMARIQPTVVKFAGDPFFIFQRRVVELLSFENDAGANNIMNKDLGCCEDVIICNELHNKGISIFCDFRARMHHLKINDNTAVKESQVGKKKPWVEWQLKTPEQLIS